MHYTQFVGAEEIQCNIDTQCKKNKQSNYLEIYSTISYSFLKGDLGTCAYSCIYVLVLLVVYIVLFYFDFLFLV